VGRIEYLNYPCILLTAFMALDLYYLESAGYVETTAPLLQTLQDEGSGKF